MVSGTAGDDRRPCSGPVRSSQSRAVGRATCAGVQALQLAADCTHDESTPQPAPHLEGLVMRRYQEALLAVLLLET